VRRRNPNPVTLAERRARRAAVAAAYKAGAGFTELARRSGFELSTIARILKEAGVPARQGRKIVSAQTKARGIALRRQGVSVNKIAETLDVAVTTVTRWCRKQGLGRTSKAWLAGELRKLRAGHASGLTSRSIAKTLPGRTHLAVRAKLTDLGLKPWYRDGTFKTVHRPDMCVAHKARRAQHLSGQSSE
jgi:transposase